MLPIVLMIPLLAAAVVLLAIDGGGAPVGSAGVAAVAVWWGLLLGLALSWIPRTRPPRIALVCLALLALFAALTGLSGLWAPSAERAMEECARVSLYLGVLALPIVAAKRGEAGRWADGLALGIVTVAVLALAQRLLPQLMPDDQLAGLLPDAATRLTYPIGYWNGLAIFVALCVPLLLRIATGSSHLAWRAAAMAPLPIVASVIFLTSSRGGVAVAVVGAGVFVALCPHRFTALLAVLAGGAGSAAAVGVIDHRAALVDGPFGSAAAESQGAEAALLVLGICALTALVFGAIARYAPRRFGIPKPVGVAVLAAAAGLALVLADPGARLDDFRAVPADDGQSGAAAIEGHLTSGGGSGRWQFWDAAVDQFKEHPLTGDGANSYEPWWAQHGSLDWFVRNAHSLWLETLGGLGVLGLLLIAGCFAAGGLAGVRRMRRAPEAERITLAALLGLVAAVAAAAAIDWVWQLPVIAAVGMAGLGLLVSAASEPGGGEAPREPGRSRASARAAAIAACALVLLLQFTILVGHEELHSSRQAASRGDLDAARDHADRARRWQPWASSAHTQLALVAERAGDLPAARRHVSDAIGHDRTDWRLHLVAARLAAKTGDARVARRELAIARRLNPRSPALTRRE